MIIPEVSKRTVQVSSVVTSDIWKTITERAPLSLIRRPDPGNVPGRQPNPYWQHLCFWDNVSNAIYGLPKTMPSQWSDDPDQRGKVGKRLTKKLAAANFDTDSKPVKLLVQHIQNTIPDKAEYMACITHDLDWEAGDFGDKGSCFFKHGGEREADRLALLAYAQHSALAGAVCVYDRVPPLDKPFYKTNPPGIARALLVVNDEQDAIVLFNAYGLPSGQLALIAGALLDLTFYPVRGLEADFYVNRNGYRSEDNSPTSVFCTSRKYAVPLCTYIDPRDYEPYTCATCGFTSADHDQFTSVGWSYYCEDCLAKRFWRCSQCHKYFQKNGPNSRLENLSGLSYCKTCAHDLADTQPEYFESLFPGMVECPHCERFIPVKDTVLTADGTRVCKHDYKARYCQTCRVDNKTCKHAVAGLWRIVQRLIDEGRPPNRIEHEPPTAFYDYRLPNGDIATISLTPLGPRLHYNADYVAQASFKSSLTTTQLVVIDASHTTSVLHEMEHYCGVKRARQLPL